MRIIEIFHKWDQKQFEYLLCLRSKQRFRQVIQEIHRFYD